MTVHKLLLCISVLFSSFQLSAQRTIATSIPPPNGYIRQSAPSNSFTSYLRSLPLHPEGHKVLLYNGKKKTFQASAHSVINMEIGTKDLQQCADAVIRLRAEYLWKQQRFSEIKFNFTNGFSAQYTKWAEGKRIKVNGNRVEWYNTNRKPDYSYPAFRQYLDYVFMYAGTASLSRELPAVPYSTMQPGDVFIQGGSPGHAVIVVDVVTHRTTKKKAFLLAQSYMPAQEIHVLVNYLNLRLSPWYELADDDSGKLYTPEWVFQKKDLKRFN